MFDLFFRSFFQQTESFTIFVQVISTSLSTAVVITVAAQSMKANVYFEQHVRLLSQSNLHFPAFILLFLKKSLIILSIYLHEGRKASLGISFQ